MFQLFYRDLLTPDIIKEVEEEPNDMRQKVYLSGIVQGFINSGEWQTIANQQKIKRKTKEWKDMKKRQGGGVVRQFLASAGSAASSAVSAGLQEVGKGVVKGALSAMTGT